jgi:hypothetical protein
VGFGSWEQGRVWCFSYAAGSTASVCMHGGWPGTTCNHRFTGRVRKKFIAYHPFADAMPRIVVACCFGLFRDLWTKDKILRVHVRDCLLQDHWPLSMVSSSWLLFVGFHSSLVTANRVPFIARQAVMLLAR